MNITYQEGKIEQLDEIVALFKRAVENMDAHGIPQWDEIYPTREIIKGDILAHKLVAGMIDGKIAVVFALYPECDPQYANGKWHDENDKFTVIHRLCVHPDFQNLGIARRTLDVIKETAREQGIEYLRLDVFSLNPHALKLYRTDGFVYVGDAHLRKGLFYLMEKAL